MVFYNVERCKLTQMAIKKSDLQKVFEELDKAPLKMENIFMEEKDWKNIRRWKIDTELELVKETMDL
jgi:hypothetical protein